MMMNRRGESDSSSRDSTPEGDQKNENRQKRIKSIKLSLIRNLKSQKNEIETCSAKKRAKPKGLDQL